MTSLHYYAYQGTHDINPMPHLHDQLEIYIALNSVGKFFLRERQYPLQVGTLFIIDPFEIHHCFDDPKQETTRYVIRFPREEIETLSTQETDLTVLFAQAPHHLLMSQRELAGLSILMENLLTPVKTWGQDIALNIKLKNFILEVGKILHDHSLPAETEKLPQNNLVDKIIQYIYSHYQEEITLDELSSHLYLSRSRMCKIFKDNTGFSINSYLTMYRLQVACVLLQQGQRVNTVSKTVGFKSYAHFIRTFTSKLGKSPTKFVREHTV